MAPKTKDTNKQTVNPTLPALKAVNLLTRQLDRSNQIINLNHDDPLIKEWEATTAEILELAFGKPNGDSHRNTNKFLDAYPIIAMMSMTHTDYNAYHKKRTEIRQALIRSCIEQLTDFGDTSPQSSKNDEALEKLELISKAFHRTVLQLRRRHDGRDTLDVKDEYDTQDLLMSLLKIFFADVRKEEWTPSTASKSSRIDFLLKIEEVAVEVKKTRSNLKDKELGEELIQDISRYTSHSDCKTLVCFIYDPDGYVANPTGLKNDLEKKTTDACRVVVHITPDH